MSDGTQLGAPVGTGDLIATDDAGAPGKVQIIKLAISADGSATVIPADATVGLRVDPASVAVADGGTLPSKGVQVGGTDGSVFQVMSTDNAGRPNVNVNGTVPVSGPLTDTQLRASAVPVSGTVTASGPLTDTQLRASAVPVDTELPAAAALADAAANPTAPATGGFGMLWNGTTWDRAKGDATNGAFVNVKSSVLPTGASTAAKQPALGTAGVAATDVITVQGIASGTVLPVSGTVTANLGTAAVTNAGTFAVQIAANSSVNQAQVAGTATDTNSGNKSAGTQRVVIATDQPQLTNALKVDPSGVTSPVSGTVTANIAAAAGAAGLSKFHLVSAASTNATSVKASAGKLHGWYIYNSNAAARKVAFHNTAGTPTAGASVTDTLVIPPSSAANAFSEIGIAFSTGIAITTVTDLTDAGTTAVGANDLIIGLWYV